MPILKIQGRPQRGARRWPGLPIDIYVVGLPLDKHLLFFGNAIVYIRLPILGGCLWGSVHLHIGHQFRGFGPAKKARGQDWHKEKARRDDGKYEVSGFTINGFCPSGVVIEMGWECQKEFETEDGDDQKSARFEEGKTLQKFYKPLCHKAHGKNTDENADANQPNIVGESHRSKHIVERKSQVHDFHGYHRRPERADEAIGYFVKPFLLFHEQVVLFLWRGFPFEIAIREVQQINPAEGLEPPDLDEPCRENETETAKNVGSQDAVTQRAGALVLWQVHDHRGEHRGVVNGQEAFNNDEVEYDNQRVVPISAEDLLQKFSHVKTALLED